MNSALNREIEELARNALCQAGTVMADAVTAAAIAEARVFAETIDFSRVVPEVGIEPDGALTFEWHRSARLTLSKSVHGFGVLHYAALLGTERICGTEAFRARMPAVLRDLIMRIEQQDTENLAP
jgi:hypothetical protein